MKKFILLITFLLVISIPQKAQALTKYANSSASLATSQIKGVKTSDERVIALENILKKYDSPLIPYASSYVQYADFYGIDWKLLPSISGLESSFGRFYIPNSYNAYGWGGGYIYFQSWEDGIDKINSSLRKNYYDRGADTIYKIGPIYAEAGHWSISVSRFSNEIDEEYIKIITASLEPNL